MGSEFATLLAQLPHAPSLARLILDLDGACPGEGELLLPENVWEMVVRRAKVELGEPEGGGLVSDPPSAEGS